MYRRKINAKSVGLQTGVSSLILAHTKKMYTVMKARTAIVVTIARSAAKKTFNFHIFIKIHKHGIIN